MVHKFRYEEIAILRKGGGLIVKVGLRFRSKVTNKKRNPSGVSYYIDGYLHRNWCFEEELKKITIFGKLFRFICINKYVKSIRRNS